MIPSFIITFRETLEAALIIGIILAYLKKTKREQYNRIIIAATVLAIIVSILSAIGFNFFTSGFEGRVEEIFEGVTMLLGSILIATLVFWMMRQKNLVADLHQKIETQFTRSQEFGLFSVVFISILREGIETVLFLGAVSIASTENNALGALLGIVVAVVVGYGMYRYALHFNLKKFFFVTGVLLLIFAAGLFAHGIHELQEAKVIPVYIEHVWDINPVVLSDGSYPLFHENGYIGSILKGLIGYNGNPSLLEVVGYLGYWAVLITVIRLRYTKDNS